MFKDNIDIKYINIDGYLATTNNLYICNLYLDFD